MDHVDHVIIEHPSRPELNDKHLMLANTAPDAAIETLKIDGEEFFATGRLVALAQADGMFAEIWRAKLPQSNPVSHA